MLRPESPTNAGASEGFRMSSRELRILIVDDEVDTCDNLSDILTDLGYLVDVAYEGQTALALVAQNTFDIALLDLRMPGMNGLELYRHIKEISAGTVAIIVTAYATSDTARSVMEAGAWSIVSKPVDVPHLVGLVRDASNSPLILVVDDDSDLCENLWEIFREHNYRVHLAHDANEAERVLRLQSFQVILLDMRLPGENGVSVFELIQKTNQQAQILIITGYPTEMESRVQQTLAAGAKAVCYKPFDVTSLLSTIHELIEVQQV
jgi:two-component system response regulator HydG